MKIAITAEGKEAPAKVDPRFGRTKWFAVFDTDTENWNWVSSEQALNRPQGAGIQAAQHVVNNDVEVVLTGHCGPKAFQTLTVYGAWDKSCHVAAGRFLKSCSASLYYGERFLIKVRIANSLQARAQCRAFKGDLGAFGSAVAFQSTVKVQLGEFAEALQLCATQRRTAAGAVRVSAFVSRIIRSIEIQPDMNAFQVF